MMSDTQFTVIATCYNDSGKILSYFEDVREQTIQPVKYILADGGSKDDTVKKVEEYREKEGCPIEIISGRRLNIAQGYNESIKAAETEVIIITGIGNAYDVNFFRSLIEYYEINRDEIVYGVTYGKYNTHFSRVYNKLYVGGNSGIHPLPTNRGLLIRKEVFDKIGYFYEHLVYAGEDVELFDLAKKSNVKIGFTEKAKLYWDAPRTLKEYIKQQRVYFIGGLQLYGINKKSFIRSIVCWLFMVAYVVIGAFYLNSAYPYIGLGVLYTLLSLCIKDIRPSAFLLKLFEVLSPIVFLINNHKYTSLKYRVKR